MTENVNVQYVGFEAKALVREYSFVVRQASSETREFSITIVNEAFTSRRLSYQDGPNLCSLKLHRELATFSNHPPQTHYRISEAELRLAYGEVTPSSLCESARRAERIIPE